MKKLKSLLCVATALVLCTGIFAGCGGNSENGNGGESVCTHTSLTKVEGKNATCIEEGNYTYYKCDGCNELFSDKNGQRPTTMQDVTIEKTRHDMHRYEEKVGNYNEYYFCNICGRYYTDFAGNSEIPYEELLDSSVTPIPLPNGWTDPAGANAENRDFTIRCFVGWSDSAGKGFSSFPDKGTVWVNVNLNRKITLTGDGWYNFGVAYNKANGLQYKNFEAGNLTKVAPEFTMLFVNQGGIWVRIVREGTNCSFYFEDKYGIPILISSNAHFDESEALYRFAYGVPEDGSVAGWTLSSANAEICWGIANPRCVFSEQ